MLANEMQAELRKTNMEGDMKFRRYASGALFVLGVYFFGMYLTAADGATALADNLLFVLFGSNPRAGIDCENASPPLPCNPGVVRIPNGAVEIVDLGTNQPTLRKSIDLGAANPTSLAVAPNGKRFYFVDGLNRAVYTVDSATGAFLRTTPIPEGPLDCVLSVDGLFLYVTTEEPSVVTLDVTTGVVVGKSVPGQGFPEVFGGIALNHGPDTDQLAVAATSSAQAYYLFGAKRGSVGAGQRFEVANACLEPYCRRSDDVTYAASDRLLLTSLLCGQLFDFSLPSGTQISGGSFGKDTCLPLNPQNSLLYSPLTQWAYLVTRRASLGIYPGGAAVDPATFSSFFISSFHGIPEAAAFASDMRSLYIVSQVDPNSQLGLDRFDAVTGVFSPMVYGFSRLIQGRTAIDAKIVQAKGVFTILVGGLPFVGAKSLAGSLGQLALLAFGLALLKLDGRWRRRQG
jgi:hypothetical protein